MREVELNRPNDIIIDLLTEATELLELNIIANNPFPPVRNSFVIDKTTMPSRLLACCKSTPLNDLGTSVDIYLD